MSKQNIEYDERQVKIDFLAKNQRTIADIERERAVYVDSIPKKPIEMIQEKNTRSSKDFNEEALKGIHDCNLLAKLFFSKKNMQIIQNSIRKQIYDDSEGKYLISEQDASTLSIIMRSIYLQEGDHGSNVTKEIEKLNYLVLDWAIPKIMSNIKQDIVYLKDVGKVPEPIPTPRNVDITGTKLTRQFQPFFTAPVENKELDKSFQSFSLT